MGAVSSRSVLGDGRVVGRHLGRVVGGHLVVGYSVITWWENGAEENSYVRSD